MNDREVGLENIQKFNWSGQLELFPMTAGAVLAEVGITAAMGTLLYEKAFLSFDPPAKSELTPAEAAELEFVGTLFSSGLPLTFIEKMLSGLDAPFSYSIHDSYWDFRAARWRPLPCPPPLDESASKYLEECFFENNSAKLIELHDRIEDMLYKMNAVAPAAAAVSANKE